MIFCPLLRLRVAAEIYWDRSSRILVIMSAYGKGVKPLKLGIEHGAELEGWRRFIKRFEIAPIGAGLQKPESEEVRAKAKAGPHKQVAIDREQRKAALLLDCMGELGEEIFETWDIDVPKIQYGSIRKAFEAHCVSKENIVATRHQFLSQEQQPEEPIERYMERLERAGKTCRLGICLVSWCSRC